MVHGEGIEPRADDVVAEDPAAPVKGVQRQAASAKKRAFTLEELRTVLKSCGPGVEIYDPFRPVHWPTARRCRDLALGQPGSGKGRNQVHDSKNG